MPREGVKQINITMAKKTYDKIRKAWEGEESEKKTFDMGFRHCFVVD